MATIHDVAKLAKVSTATVSNAFNWPDKVRPDTYERILAAAKALNYQPNIFAKGLSSGKTFNVGLLISDIRVPIVANVTRGIEDRLTEADYVPIISSTDGDSDKTLRRADQLRRLGGACGYIIVPAQFGVTSQVIDHFEKLHQEGIPTIVSGHDIQSERVSSVSSSGRQMARELTQHLIDLNHRHIAYIGTSFSRGRGVQRWLGFEEAMHNAQIPIRTELVVEAESSPTVSFEAMEKLMALDEPPTAIFAMNDILNRGVIDYVAKYNVSVPAELSLVTFDYLALAQRTTPHITSVVMPAYDLGVMTADLFLELQTGGELKPRMLNLPYTFADRGSTAAPPS